MNALYHFFIYWYVLSKTIAMCYADNVLVTNVTVEFAETYQSKCIKLLKPDNLIWSEERKLFLIKKIISETHMCGMYNLEDYLKSVNKTSTFTCFKPIQIVLGTEKGRKCYEQLSELHSLSDGIWLVFLNDTSISDFFQKVQLEFNVQVIVAQMEESNFVHFYEVYRVDQNFPIRIQYFGNWTAERGLKILKGPLYSRRRDLEGKVLKTGSTENWPFSSFKSPLTPDKPWDGLYPRVWGELQQLLNFTSINIRSPDNTAGIKDENGMWSGLIGMVLRKEIDIIASELKVTNERLEVLDFTYPLISSWYQVFFKQPGYNLQWQAVFKPFDQNVWIAVIVWILAGALCLSFCYYYSLLYGYEDSLDTMKSPTESFFFMIQALCQQGSQTVPKSASCRLLFYLSYLVSSVLIPSYAASLISSLTTHVPSRPFDSLEEFLKNGKYELFVEANTAEFSFFANASDPTLKSISKKLLRTISGDTLGENSAAGIDLVCNPNKNYAYFGVFTSIDSKIELKQIHDCEILTFTRQLTAVSESMALLKNNPYFALINYYLHKMVENGVINEIRQAVLPYRERKISVQWNPVQKEEVFQIFVFLCTGVITSVVFFIAEKFWSKFHYKLNKKKEVQKDETLKKYY